MHDVLNEVRCEQKGKKADRKKNPNHKYKEAKLSVLLINIL